MSRPSPRDPLPAALLVVLALALLPASTAAAERVLRLDRAASEISFVLDATAHEVEGTLDLVEGEVRFDQESGEASGKVVVDARSADTGNDRRDRDMHRKVLESEEYPRIVFRPVRVEGAVPGPGAAEGTVELVGTVAIHGSEHRLTLPAQVELEGDRLRAIATFNVPYVEWGMEDPSFLFLRVAKKVEVTVRVEGTLGAAGASRSGGTAQALR